MSAKAPVIRLRLGDAWLDNFHTPSCIIIMIIIIVQGVCRFAEAALCVRLCPLH